MERLTLEEMERNATLYVAVRTTEREKPMLSFYFESLSTVASLLR